MTYRKQLIILVTTLLLIGAIYHIYRDASKNRCSETKNIIIVPGYKTRDEFTYADGSTIQCRSWGDAMMTSILSDWINWLRPTGK